MTAALSSVSATQEPPIGRPACCNDVGTMNVTARRSFALLITRS